MKILLITPKFYPENFSCYQLAKCFTSSGHEVTVFTGAFVNNEIPTYEEINNIKIYRNVLYKNKKNLFSRVKNYFSFVKCGKKFVKKCEEKYDLVYSFQISPVIMLKVGKNYAEKFNVKHVGHVLDLWPDSVVQTKYTFKHSILYMILNSWSKKLYRSLDEVVVGSPSFKEYFIDKLKMDKNIISYVPQPSIIEVDKVVPEQHDELNVVYCGNIGKLQRIDILVKIANNLKDEKVKFHIIGSGFYSNKIIKLINNYNLTNVVYYGWKNAQESAEIISKCDLAYLYLQEGGYVGKTIPNKLMMYMSLGKPVLAVTKGDAKEIVFAAKGGYFADNSVDLIEKEIQELIKKDPQELVQKGLNNYAYYNQSFKAEKLSNKLISLFSK